MSTPESTLGRPRDPAVDGRIRQTVLDLYATHGWQALTMDAVAKEAGVGKSALYRRWSNKGDMLIDALYSMEDIAEVDTGRLREDLLVLAQQFADKFFGKRQTTILRFIIESRIIPELMEAGEALNRSQVLAGRGIIRRGIARKELPPHASPTVLMAMLHGAVMTHSLSYPKHLEERVRRELPMFLEDLVDAVIAGAQGR